MDVSYRSETLQQTPAADMLEMTWTEGEPVQERRIKPSPLNTARLKVFRQVTRGVILSILETGHVTMEILKRTKADVDRVAELFVVSADGQEIYIEQWKADNSGGYDKGNSLNHTIKTFAFDSLPEKYWKKYSHACKFVDLVKSKTAKVTMYSEKAKGVLMENQPPNFETTFYQGPRIVIVGTEVHIKEDSGASIILQRDSLHSLVNNYTMDLIHHATQMREQCLRLEASVMTVQAMSPNTEQLFPVSVGMKPATSFCSSSSSNSESMDLWLSPRSCHQHASPSNSHAYAASPPPSPIPPLDLRFEDTPQKVLPAPQPSSSTDRMSSSATPGSPLRHLSTLEGRKWRYKLSNSSETSFTQAESTHLSGSLTQRSNPIVLNPVMRVEESGQKISCGHGLANSLVFGAEVESSQPVLPSTPSRPTEVREAAHHTPTPVLAVPASSSLPSTPQRPGLAGRTVAQTPKQQGSASQVVASTPALIPTTPAADSAVKGGHVTSITPHKEQAQSVMRQAFVAYTGWATQLGNGSIWVHYNEGTQLGVSRDQTEVVYIDQQSQRHRYLQSDSVPEVVRQKLERLPSVISSLFACPASTHGLSSP